MNKKILIVEDEVSLLMALGEKFSQEGFDIIEAKDGEEGLKMAIKKKPDLILLDIIMPVMDGITMLKKLREAENGKNTPVIVLTNLSDEQAVVESIQNGVNDYLVKTNWSLDDVVKQVKKKLRM
jgi:DNA-binding response OmpR family regulator